MLPGNAFNLPLAGVPLVPPLHGKGKRFALGRTWKCLEREAACPGLWETIPSHPWLFAAPFHPAFALPAGSTLAGPSLEENSLCCTRSEHALRSPRAEGTWWVFGVSWLSGSVLLALFMGWEDSEPDTAHAWCGLWGCSLVRQRERAIVSHSACENF